MYAMLLLYSVLVSAAKQKNLMCCWALFSVLAPPELLIYEMAENGKNCDQRRVAMSKEQHNGSFPGKEYRQQY